MEVATHFINTLEDHLRGGFAPPGILMREFHYDKSGIVLNGLHFSAYSLLLHMDHRQKILLQFMKNPERDHNLWPEAYWPDQYKPRSKKEWEQVISSFEEDIEKMVTIVSDPETDLLKVYPNGKSLYWAAATNLHHNAYHIGQRRLWDGN